MNSKELKKAVEQILSKQGVMNYSDWKNSVINTRKLEIMSDKDKSWTDKTIESASLELIVANMANTDEAEKEQTHETYQNN